MSPPSIEILPPPGPSVHSAPTSPPFIHPSVAPVFLSALSVRIPVFVDEQHCSAEEEIDADDARSWHWVAYVSAGDTVGGRDGKVAAGTIRLVPVAPLALAGNTHAERLENENANEDEDEERRGQALGPRHGATEMWDGAEPFVKLGRMATLKEYRGLGLGRLLVGEALEWLRGNADQVTGEMGVGEEGEDEDEVGKERGAWKGLVLVHAQKEVERFWAGVGFVRDVGMGVWWEEGIEHVGMWRRVDLR